MRTEGVFAVELGELEAVACLEPDAVPIDEGDEADRSIADRRGELGQGVEGRFPGRVEDRAVDERAEPSGLAGLGCCLRGTGVRKWGRRRLWDPPRERSGGGSERISV
jgi:hypothetical protein